MLLSELVYEIIKRILGNAETKFYYDNFVKGDFDDDYRVEEAHNAIFLPINEAIARLSDLDKIDHEVIKLVAIKGEMLLPMNTKTIYAIQDYSEYQYDFIRTKNQEVFIKELDDVKIARLLVEVSFDHVLRKGEEVNLQSLGITNQMCPYIIEYVYGKYLLETSPSEASIHINTAESYFNNLKTATRMLNTHVKQIHSI